ncbi:MAG: site-specific integrase [Bacteroidaceae bacterium]|nr:site-specific integrase [Bacteroidaceae bacterium]
MASVKVMFRASTVDAKQGVIYYQIIHNRIVRQLVTDYRIFSDEWDGKSLVSTVCDGKRRDYLNTAKERIEWDLKRLHSIINQLQYRRRQYSAEDVITTFKQSANEYSLFNFMQGIIVRLQRMGKQRTSETYQATLCSFMQFREGQDIMLEDIDADLMLIYEAYLRSKGLARNSTSFYMRILRAVYNRAVEKGMTANCNPFKSVYTGVDKTIKRAIPIKAIKQIKNLDLTMRPSLEFARDMFLFSFYTRGMSFIDIAYLKKKDLANGVLSYRRRKTGQQLLIRWEKCMQEVVKKYESTVETHYLLPIITQVGKDERAQYKAMLRQVNYSLKKIAALVAIPVKLTMYVARHSWASAAKSKNIPISVISEGMGHDSEMTTQIYLASLDTAVVDRANAQILKDL